MDDASLKSERDGEPSRARIEQRFRANSGLIIAARVVTACMSLATIPVVVSRLGVTGFGTWEALLALASLPSLFQVAISGTLVWRMSEAFGRSDSVEIRRLAKLGSAGTWILCGVLGPLAWLLREPAVRFLGVPTELHQAASAMFPIAAVLVLLNGFCETLESVVSGCQRTGLVNVVGAAAHFLNYSVVILATLLGWGLWSLVMGQAVAFIFRFAGARVAARVSFGAVSLTPSLPRRSDPSMLRYSGLLTVGSVASLLRDQTDKIILSSLASPSWVGYYGMAARLAGLVMEIIRFFYLPILTAAGALNAMGDWDGVRRLYSRLMAAVSIVTGLIVVVVAGLADRIVVLWMGRAIPEVTLLLWLLVSGSATAAMLTGPGTAVCRGCGRVGIETTYLTFNLVLNVILTIVLVIVMGPLGTAVATGLTWAVSSILFLFVLHMSLDLPLEASRRAATTAVLAAGVSALVYWASMTLGLPADRRAALISVVWLGTVGGLVYLGLVFALRLSSFADTYGALRSLVRRA